MTSLPGDIEMELEVLLREAKWQPIETAPKDGMHILAGSHGVNSVIGHWDEFSKHIVMQHTGWAIYPTHWMPLPASPSLSPAQRSSIPNHPEGGK